VLEEACNDILRFGVASHTASIELHRLRRAAQLHRNGSPVPDVPTRLTLGTAQ
jgi:hypothetical protein